MPLLYGIKAFQQQAGPGFPHVFGFNTVRSTSDDTLLEVWNGNASSARVHAVDKDGKLYSAAATAGDLLYAVTGGVGQVRRLDSLAIGTQYQVLQTNAGATAPEWTSSIGIDGTPITAVYTGILKATGVVTFTAASTVSMLDGVTIESADTTVPLYVKQGGASAVQLRMRSWGAGNPYLNFEVAGGSEGSEAAVAAAADLGRIAWYPHDGTSWNQTANIQAQATQLFTGTAHGTRLIFQVTPHDSVTPANILELDTTGTGTLFIQIGAEIRINGTDRLLQNSRMTGWTPATGTATRTTFVTSTVTLEQLAERTKALIDDLHATAGHGLIGT